MPLTAEDPPRAAGAKPRGRVALLSAIVALVVALPLAQELRVQADELAAVDQERSGLDPLARAVDVQRSLTLHRDLAGQVLRGQLALEPRRADQQRGVDAAVAALGRDLDRGFWPRAQIESEALRGGWLRLGQAITALRIGAPQSDLEHRLLVEHCLQITDDLADAGMRHAGLRAGDTTRTLQDLHALPRQMWRTAQAAHSPAPTVEQAAAVLAAQMQHFAGLHAAAAQLLAERGSVLERQRTLLLAALAGLGLLVIGLLLWWARGRRNVPAGLPPAALRATLRDRDAAPGDSTTRAALHRMRDAQTTVPQDEAQTTQPLV